MTPGPDAAPRDRWRRFGAPVLAVVIVPALCLGMLLGWVAFGDRHPADDSPEAGFARDMSEHHAQATEMSLLVLPEAETEGVRILASDIIGNQQFERGMMATWLEDWGLPRARDGERMLWMAGSSHEHHLDMELPAGVPMHGMATPTELQELGDASGQEAEILYLQLMTTHHIAGVEMADAALELSDQPQVLAAAQRMVDNQAFEIDLMNDLLEQHGAEPREDIDAFLEEALSDDPAPAETPGGGHDH